MTTNVEHPGSDPAAGFLLVLFRALPGPLPLALHPAAVAGVSPAEELLEVMRSMGQNPTEDELLNMILEVM